MADEINKSTVLSGTTKPAEMADMEKFQASPYYQTLGIGGLQEQLKGYQTDDAALRQQAEAQYNPTYQAELEALRQELAQERQGYSSQIASLDHSYDQQRRRTNQSYDESAVDLNNALTKRGLGRSSLVSTQGAYLENRRNQALSDIDASQRGAVDAINEKIALLTDQAAQRERSMAGNYARQLENRVNELKAQNQSASISLQLQIAALQQQGYEAYQKWLLDNRAQELREKTFEAEYGLTPSLSYGGSARGNLPKSSGAQTQEEKKSISSTLKGYILPVANVLKNLTAKAQPQTKVSGSPVKGMGDRRMTTGSIRMER